jgi:uncharacterized protein YcbX
MFQEKIKGDIDMTTIGTVESLWRYPVKSMKGEAMTEAFMGFSGFYGDRCFAFKNSAAPVGFPYLTAREQQQMLLYRSQFRNAERAARPPNLAEALSLAPGLTPTNAEPNDFDLDITTPSGAVFAASDPALLEMLGEGLRGENRLTLARSERALTDCRPVSLISLETVEQAGDELGFAVDKRRFRANIYVNFAATNGFGEDALVGRKLRIGSHAEITILERDPRCKMISLDPDTGEHNPEVLRQVAQTQKPKPGFTAPFWSKEH